MTNINKVWYTHEYVSAVIFQLSKEKIEKNTEGEQNMEKIMTHPHILSINVMGKFGRSTNVVGVERTSLEEIKFQAL